MKFSQSWDSRWLASGPVIPRWGRNADPIGQLRPVCSHCAADAAVALPTQPPRAATASVLHHATVFVIVGWLLLPLSLSLLAMALVTQPMSCRSDSVCLHFTLRR